jgi:hypothetical protein
MGIWVKTTIDIADGLFEDARRLARQQKTTLKAVVEASLRKYISEAKPKAKRFVLRDGSFKGNGLQPGIREGDWEQLRAMIYEGRGG